MTASSGSCLILGYPEAGSPPRRLALRESAALVAREESANEDGALRRPLHILLTSAGSPMGMTAQLHLRSPGNLALFTPEAEICWHSELSQRGFYTEGFWIRVPVPFLIGAGGCGSSQGESKDGAENEAASLHRCP